MDFLRSILCLIQLLAELAGKPQRDYSEKYNIPEISWSWSFNVERHKEKGIPTSAVKTMFMHTGSIVWGFTDTGFEGDFKTDLTNRLRGLPIFRRIRKDGHLFNFFSIFGYHSFFFKRHLRTSRLQRSVQGCLCFISRLGPKNRAPGTDILIACSNTRTEQLDRDQL